MRRGGEKRRASILFILVTLVLDILGIGIVIPILPQIVDRLVVGDAGEAAFYYGLIAASYAFAQFLFAPVVGALSDRFGRRPIILISLFGAGASYLVMAFAPTLTWLLIGRLVSGIMGATITTANAYIADISTPETRAQNFGMVGVAFGIGFVIGPALGGLLGTIGPRLPFFVAAGLVVLNGIYGLFVLPESLAPDMRRRFSWHRANLVSSLLRLRRDRLIAVIALAYLLLGLSQRGLETVWVLYTDYRYGWQELANGLSLALVGVVAAFVQGFLIRKAIPRLGERRTVLFGLSFATVGLLLYGLASQGWIMLAVIAVFPLGGLAAPAMQAIVTGRVPADEQGEMQGALSSLLSLSSVLAPLIFATGLFSYFTSDAAPVTLPGAPFFVGALLSLSALFILARQFSRIPPQQDAVSQPEQTV